MGTFLFCQLLLWQKRNVPIVLIALVFIIYLFVEILRDPPAYPPVTPVLLFNILIFRSPPSTPFTPVPYLVLLQIAEQQHDIEDADNSAYEQQQPFGGRAVSVVAHYLWGRGQIDLQENGPGKLDAQQHLGVNKSLERIRDEENDD